MHVLYDDTVDVPDEVRELIRIDHFGAIVYRRSSLCEALESVVAEAGLPATIILRESLDWTRLAGKLQRDEIGGMFLVCPANVYSTCPPETLATFLRQACYAPNNLLMPLHQSGRPGWALMTAQLLKAYIERRLGNDLVAFYDAKRPEFSPIEGRLGLVDLSEGHALIDFLSGAFDVRHFNAIEWEGYTITKRSTDTAKLRQEYDLYDLLPPRMQNFFLRPFDFTERDGVAQYRMERLFVPDMAVQWLQGGYELGDFSRFLDQVFYFVMEREARSVTRDLARAKQESLYVTKLVKRIEDLKKLKPYASLAILLETQFGGVDRLVERYLRLFERRRDRFPLDRLVIGHGDLCFSNILYSKTNRFMRLIDARGASNANDLYTDPYYDLAKLSHSVLGNYDAINQDMFDIKVDKHLRLSLVFDRSVQTWVRELFLEKLTHAGFDPALTRLAESSLFISMLPLHIDRPHKVLAFAINADTILNELEKS
jgi:thiamine kinase-like enzyme